jgi:hypothetical protein
MLDVLNYIPEYTVEELLALSPVGFYCVLKVTKLPKLSVDRPKDTVDVVCNGWTVSADYRIIEIRYTDRSYFIPSERVLELIRVIVSKGVPVEND